MVRTRGTKGNPVDIEILGIGEVMRDLQSQGKKISKGADFGVVRAGTFIQEEIKESIMGNRAEPKSVDTGKFANSIKFEKTGKAEGKVVPEKVFYPGGQTTKNVAKMLEYGTSRISPRRHFRNTQSRNSKKVKDIIEREIKDEF